MKYFIMGEDKRSLELKKFYSKKELLCDSYFDADVIITSIPFTRDNLKVTSTAYNISDLITCVKERGKILISGNIPIKIKDELDSKNVRYYDLMNIESFVYKNALATCEGAIYKAIENSKKTLSNSNILILGFGRIGKLLSNMLKTFNSSIYVEARKQSDLALIDALGYKAIDLNYLGDYLDRFDFIFNTVPSQIFDGEKLSKVNKNVTIIDLASLPGGIDFDMARKLELNVDLCLSLPSKVTPISSAKYILEEVEKIIV